MPINMSGHHLEITDSIRNNVNTKVSKVLSRYSGATSTNAILSVEKQSQKIELNTQYLGGRVSVHASNRDLYAAIADAAKKLDSALQHRKGSIKNFNRDKLDVVDQIENHIEDEAC